MSSSSNNNSAETLVTTVAAIASVAALSLGILQSDTASRILLNSKKLQAKRVKEYQYKWEWTLSKFLLRVPRRGRDQQMDRGNTEVFFEKDDIETFIQTVLLNNKHSISIMSVEVDDVSGEYFVIFRNHSSGVLYQCLLVPFGVALHDAMEDKLTSTTLLFIADASSGLGVTLFSTILTECKAGVATIQEPFWMVLFSQLVEKNIFSTQDMEKLLFGLCRFQAWRVEKDVGAAKTVAFILPGQACTPALLPLLQAVFPCERHLFAYDGCVNSVKRALQWRTSSDSAAPSDFDMPFHDAITATTPMSPISLTASIKTLADSLSKLSIQHADTTETWMSSVHAFLEMKDKERTNDFLPFVCKLSLLVNNESMDSPDSSRRMALQNVLQFVTGSRSRPLAAGILDAGIKSLRDLSCSLEPLPELSKRDVANIEDCVFQHKSILIENKTLVDTVVPQKEWTLKAAKKISGCACCAPEEDEEEEESTVAKRERSRPKYVDGKTAFAFDPTQFG